MIGGEDSSISSKDVVKVVGLCVVWYLSSSGNGVIGKTILTDFPYPLTVTLCQLIMVTLLSGPSFYVWRIRPRAELSRKYFLKIIIPLAVGKLFSSVSSHISIWKVPVSYAHTVKATMPFFVVILSRIIMKETQTSKVYFSLLPIIVGVMIATATEMSFDALGLISALAATIGFSLQNIFSKKVLRETKLHHLWLLYILAKIALCICLPIWFIFDFRRMINDHNLLQNSDVFLMGFLLFMDGILNFIQNVVAFSVLSLVSPLTYSVCTAAKRIMVILVSLVFLRNPVSLFNFLGMMLAILGVGFYNKAKFDANKNQLKSFGNLYTSKDRNGILPTTYKNPSFSSGYLESAESSQLNGHSRNFRII